MSQPKSVRSSFVLENYFGTPAICVVCAACRWSSGWLAVRALLALGVSLIASSVPLLAASGDVRNDDLSKLFNGLIRLDPICGRIAEKEVPLAPGNPSPSTRRMAERLSLIYQNAAPDSMAYLSDRLIPILQQQVTTTTNIDELVQIKFNLALHQVNAARPDSALNTFADIDRMIAESGGSLEPGPRAQLRIRKGLAFLRLGEQENCLAMHNADSCLFPLKPSAYHLLPRGSRGAISIFMQHLADYPGDLGTQWLLNLAHMTLGEYPAKVDPKFLIPAERFASEAPMPRFIDVSEGLGLNSNDLAGGCIIDDFDNDGFYDVVISAWDAKGQLRYYHNKGDGTFVERTSEAGLVGEVGALNIQQTDFNNDGLLDIWMMRGGWLAKAGRIPSSLLRNNGDGTFTDVTEEAGLLSSHPTMACRWFDYDGDGWLDLFVGNETTDSKDPDYCELYHNNTDGTFTECAEVSGVRIAAFVKGVACADYDNDGRPDLFLSVRGGRNVLFHNDGLIEREPPLRPVWRFSDRTARSSALLQQTAGFGTFFFDYDDDGWEDLLVFGYYLPRGVGDVAADYLGISNQGAKMKLFRNLKNGTFEDVTQATHLNRIAHTMGHNFGDLTGGHVPIGRKAI